MNKLEIKQAGIESEEQILNHLDLVQWTEHSGHGATGVCLLLQTSDCLYSITSIENSKSAWTELSIKRIKIWINDGDMEKLPVGTQIIITQR